MPSPWNVGAHESDAQKARTDGCSVPCQQVATKIADFLARMGRVPRSMISMRSSVLALCAIALVAPSAAAVAQTQPAMQDQGGHGFLTPELRFLYNQEQPRTDWRSMTPDQRAARRDQMRAQWDAMSAADKQKLTADLQAKWNALPADQKQMVEQRIAERRASRQQMGQQQPGSGQ